ncbi:GNAT family N-acetyltransferase [Pantoea dispersa]|uniref:GNAT family N-acetyltransferase n=1 Tax=Pantoea dispersa TaxID=59814 RepID=UPI0013311E61|nr:GNAT family N-acetyltransferase [Pantoea dispersa]KAF0856298.1 GCN5 family acetyltransferase [Pantoea dispersa 625]
MNISLLSQCPQLLDMVATMLHQEWSGFSHWRDRSAIRQRLLMRNAQPAKTFTLVALNAENEVLATASTILHELDDIHERQFWMGEVLTVAAHRGKGVASALVLRLIEEARQRHMPELWLYTPDQQAFYRRYGWQEIEQRIVSSEQVSVMRREIF